MPRITYVGPCADGVDIDDVGHCPQGASIDVPDDLVAGFLEQTDCWRPAKKGDPEADRSRAVAPSEPEPPEPVKDEPAPKPTADTEV